MKLAVDEELRLPAYAQAGMSCQPEKIRSIHVSEQHGTCAAGNFIGDLGFRPGPDPCVRASHARWESSGSPAPGTAGERRCFMGAVQRRLEGR